mgnify:CR=1 FL=1
MREQLDAVADPRAANSKSTGTMPADALGRESSWTRARAPKAIADQDRELVRGVDAVDVEARVGLGVAELLRALQHAASYGSPFASISVRM